MPDDTLTITTGELELIALANGPTPFDRLDWEQRLSVLHAYFNLRSRAAGLTDHDRTPISTLAIFIAGVTPFKRY